MKDQEIKEEFRYYVEKYYMEPLEEAGFTHLKNDVLHWYFICNGVICHLHFISPDGRYFAILGMEWWMHPTYLPANLRIPVVMYKYQEPEPNEFEAETLFFKAHQVEAGHFLNIPALPRHGVEELEERLFPQVQKLKTREITRETLYAKRKEYALSLWQKSRDTMQLYEFVRPYFADQALMVRDTEMYPYCIDYLEKKEIPNMQYEVIRKYMERSVAGRSEELLKAQLNALKGIEVDHYFELLKERKAKFFKRYHLQDNYTL